MRKPPGIITDIQPLSAFRANTARFLQRIHDTGRPLVLTQKGRGAAVVLNINAYEQLVERAEIAEDIRVAEAQLEQGEGLAHDAARKHVLSRLPE
jgi:antitoxin YefM